MAIPTSPPTSPHRGSNKTISTLAYPVLLAVLVLGTALSRLLMLGQSPWPNGADGYYYALQSLSLLQTGHFNMADSSPVLYLLAGLSALLGDCLWGSRLGAALLGAGLVLASTFLGRRGGLGKACALGLGWLCAISPGLTWMTVDYLKQSGGLVCVLWALGFLWPLGPKAMRKHRLARLWGILLLILGAWCHRSTLVLGLATLAGLALDSTLPWLKKLGQKHPGSLYGLLAGGFVLGAVALGLGLRVASGMGELARFSGSFALGPFLPLLSAGLRQSVPMPVVVESSLAALAAWILLVPARRAALPWLILLPLLVCVLPIWNLDSPDLGFRLYLGGLGMVYAVILLRWSPKPGNLTAGPLGLGSLAAGVLLLPLAGLAVYTPRRDPPYRLYEAVSARIRLPKDSLLIAHQPLNHVYTYRQHLAEALNYLPEFKVPDALLWRLAQGINPQLTLESLKAGSGTRQPEAGALAPGATVVQELSAWGIQALPGNYWLMPQSRWQELLEILPEAEVRRLENPYNPHNLRPPWLMERNREAARAREAGFSREDPGLKPDQDTSGSTPEAQR